MTLTKFKKSRLPWLSETIPTWLNTDDFFTDDFFTKKDTPAMNIKETEKNFEIELAVPGFDKKEIEVTLEEDFLRVCAEKSTKDVDETTKDYTRKEFTYNSFERLIQLPTNINPTEKIKAVYKHGILNLKLIKNEKMKEIPKKIIEVA